MRPRVFKWKGAMDLCLVMRQRLAELGLEQKDLADAAGVTESYISQLMTRKKLPPAPDRTDIYEKIEQALKLPGGKLSRLAEVQRRDAWKKRLEGPPTPLLSEVRTFVLGKCAPAREREMRAVFEKEPLGELERLVTRALLGVAKRVAREERENEPWLNLASRLTGKSYDEIRIIARDLPDSDILTMSEGHRVSLLDALIESWTIDLASFAMEITLNESLAGARIRRVEFLELEQDGAGPEEEGFEAFLRDATMSGDATTEEIELLRKLRFKRRRPTALYYYRELQSLRDPLHFRGSPPAV